MCIRITRIIATSNLICSDEFLISAFLTGERTKRPAILTIENCRIDEMTDRTNDKLTISNIDSSKLSNEKSTCCQSKFA